MKVRLVGLYEDDQRWNPAEHAEGKPGWIRGVSAKLAVHDHDWYKGELWVPAEMIRGAEIGDEFTLHLERVKK